MHQQSEQNKSGAMRKSVLGTLGLRPIRLGATSPLTPGLAVSPTKLGAKRPTHQSGKKPTPVRFCDLSKADQSFFLSSTKKNVGGLAGSKTKVPNPPNARKCLYRDEATARKNTVLERAFKIPEVPEASGTARLKESKIPKPGSMIKPQTASSSRRKSVSQARCPTKSNVRRNLHPMKTRLSTLKDQPSTSVLKTVKGDAKTNCSNCSVHSEELKEMRMALEDQKKVLQEIREETAKSLCEIKESALHEIAEMHKAMINNSRTLSKNLLGLKTLVESMKVNTQIPKIVLDESISPSTDGFIAMERKLLNDGTFRDLAPGQDNSGKVKRGRSKSVSTCEKENSLRPSGRKSLAAYREMRKSFSYLNTPTLSARKARNSKTPRTPRSSLSAKVQMQLENLLDD